MTIANSASTHAPAPSGSYSYDHARMTRPEEIEHREHHERHQDPAQRDRSTSRRRLPRSRCEKSRRHVAQRRIGDVPAVHLAERQQVPRRRQHPEPGREHHRMDVDRVAVGDRAEDEPGGASLNSSGSPSDSRPVHRHGRCTMVESLQPDEQRRNQHDEAARSGRRCQCRTARVASGMPRGS